MRDAAARLAGCPQDQVAVGWRMFREGPTMPNSKIAMLAYGIAVGFILVVAFHSPAKLLLATDDPATTLSAK
jgi:hypothetical protein